MAEQNPPIFMDGTVSPAEMARRMMAAIMGPGIARGPIQLSGTPTGDLAVSQHAGTPDMSVDVAAGACFVLGTSAVYQGTYHVENRATIVKTISAAHPTNPRKDIVVVRVRENAYDSSGVNAWDVSVVTGTAAGSPVAPSVPANCYLLATVDVPAADTAITNSQITDARSLARPWASAWGIVPGGEVTSSSVNQAPAAGADITGISVTFTAVAGRRYRAVYQTSNYDSGGAGVIRHRILDGSGTVLGSARNRSTAANQEQAVTIVSKAFTPSAGAFTVKAWGSLVAFTTNGFVFANSDSLIVLHVEDAGPA